MAPPVKHSNRMVRIILLLTIGSMVTGVGCSKPPQVLPPEDLLTEEIAKQADFLTDLHKFSSIEDAAAESLAKRKGTLNLNGLASLSDAAAEALGKHQGTLALNGLTSLSDKQAKALAKHKGYLLIGPEIQLSASKILEDAGHEGLTYSER